jgi:hypothetical protein
MTLFSNECISALNQGQVNMPINPFKAWFDPKETYGNPVVFISDPTWF